jgi:hypothetical protein
MYDYKDKRVVRNVRTLTYGVPLIILLGLILALLNGLHIETSTLTAILIAILGVPFAVDNIFLQINKSLRRQLEANAVKEINSSIVEIGEAFSIIVTYNSSFVVKPLDIPDRLWYDAAIDKHMKIMSSTLDLRTALGSFYKSLEAHEIAIIHLEPYYRFLTIKIDELIRHIEHITTDFMHATSVIDLTEDQYEQEVTRFKILYNEWGEIAAYMMDFRKMLQNDLLGDIFRRRLDPRKPLPGNGTTLDQVATKEVVQRMIDERNQDLDLPAGLA